jgi:hypothetical protein
MAVFHQRGEDIQSNCALKTCNFGPEPLLLQGKFSVMEHHNESNPQDKDFARNWVDSSSFLFYLQVFILIAFTFGCAYSLYSKRYKGRPEVPVQSSSQYTPVYK